MDTLSDLVLRCRAGGNNEEWNVLLEAVHPSLILALKAFCRQDALVDDFAQEALTKIVLRCGKCSATTFREFRAWCVKLAVRLAIDHYRKAKVRKLTILAPDEISKLRDSAAADQTVSVGLSHDAGEALKVLETLGSPCRQLLTLFYLNGLDYDEIAAVLGKSTDAVRMKIARCVKEANARLEKGEPYAK